MSDRFLAELCDDIEGMVREVSQDDLFSLLEMVDGEMGFPPLSPLHEIVHSPKGNEKKTKRLQTKRSTSSSTRIESDEAEIKGSSSNKKQKLVKTSLNEEVGQDGDHRTVHITVERNRRKQMNDNISVLRSLMPPFYVKRGDQASIIGGIVDYIKELQQVLQSLELKKQRKIYNEVLSPRIVSSPRISPLSPRKPPMSPLSPLSPKLSLPISPRTPTQPSPYKAQQGYMSPSTSPYNKATTIQQGYKFSSISTSNEPYCSSSSSFLAAKADSVAEVEVKFVGPNLLLKTKSGRVRGQVLKVIEALEALSLEILHVSISTLDDTLLNSFTIKMGIECQLSAEELAHGIQQTFC